MNKWTAVIVKTFAQACEITAPESQTIEEFFSTNSTIVENVFQLKPGQSAILSKTFANPSKNLMSIYTVITDGPEMDCFFLIVPIVYAAVENAQIIENVKSLTGTVKIVCDFEMAPGDFADCQGDLFLIYDKGNKLTSVLTKQRVVHLDGICEEEAYERLGHIQMGIGAIEPVNRVPEWVSPGEKTALLGGAGVTLAAIVFGCYMYMKE